MMSRSVEKHHPTNVAGGGPAPVDFLSRWRGRLGAVAETLVEILQASPTPVPVRVPASSKRRSPRR